MKDAFEGTMYRLPTNLEDAWLLRRRLLTLAVVVSFAGCAGGNTGHSLMLPSSSPARTASDTQNALPGDTQNALPGDTQNALPGDTQNALPGDTQNALPGDTQNALPGTSQAVCSDTTTAGQASCLAVLNLDVPILPNPNASAATIKGYEPRDIRSAYHLPDASQGKTVAIVDAYDDPLVESDLAIYR